MTVGLRGGLAGTPRGLTTSRADNSTSTSNVESLIFLIQASTAVQAERIQAIVDGAVLAVEQVQDKRIELLEKGAEVTVSDLVFDVFLGMCLAGVGKALVSITESIVKNLVQVASVYGTLPSSGVGKILSGVAAGFDPKFASRSVSIGPSDIAKYNAYVRKVVAGGITKSLGDVTKKGLEMTKRVNKVDLEGTDTPGVGVLQAAQTYISNQRAANAIHHAGFESIVRSGVDSTAQAQILNAVSYDPLPDEIVVVRDQHKMLFETIIWNKIFAIDKNVDKIKAATSGGLQIPGVKATLMDYWRKRFARTIEKWLSGLLTKSSPAQLKSDPNIGIDVTPLLNATGDAIQFGSFEKQARDYQESCVVRLFVAVSSDLAALNSQGIGSGSVSVNQQPESKK